MNQLLTACLYNRDISPLLEFPKELMTGFEKKIVEWVIGYNAEFGAPPILARAVDEFPSFIPVAYDKGDDDLPLGDINQRTLKRKLKGYWSNMLQEAMLQLSEDDDKFPEEILSKIQLVTATSSGLSKYSTFDRTKYFREGGLSIGLNLIDRATGGLGKGEMMVLVGRLGTGKTFISLFFAMKWWEEGKKVLFISNEMLASDIFARLDGIFGGFSPLFLRSTSAAGDTDRELIKTTSVRVRAEAEKKGGEIIVPNGRLITPAQVYTLAKNLQVDAVIIDGLYMMSPSSGHMSSKWERVAAVSNETKQFSLEMMIPTLALTQIKRTGGHKEEYDPEDIAYSDAIGQDADFIIALNPGSTIRSLIEMQLIKNRFGPNLTTLCKIDFDTMTLTEESLKSEPLDGWFAEPKTTHRPEEIPDDIETATSEGFWISDSEDDEPEDDKSEGDDSIEIDWEDWDE